MQKDDEHMPDGLHLSQKGSDLKSRLFFNYFLKEKIVDKINNKVNLEK